MYGTVAAGMRPIEPPQAFQSSKIENEQRANQQNRRRERSRSRDSPRISPFPNQGSYYDDRNSSCCSTAFGEAASSSCKCVHHGPCTWPKDRHRDLSIRFPGMSRESFDELMLLQDEVMMETSSSNSDSVNFSRLSKEDEVVYFPVEPELVPASSSEICSCDYEYTSSSSIALNSSTSTCSSLELSSDESDGHEHSDEESETPRVLIMSCDANGSNDAEGPAKIESRIEQLFCLPGCQTIDAL